MKVLKILVVEVAPSQGNKFLRYFDSRYVKYDNFINIIITFKRSFSKWISYEKLRRNISIILIKLSYFIHLLFMADIPFTLKVMWTFFVGRSTLVDIVLCNHSRPFVRPSVRLSVTKLSQDWVISFFWYCTWWQLTMIASDWGSQIFEKKILAARIWAKWAKISPKTCFFAIFSSLVH